MKFKSEVRKDIVIDYDWLNSTVQVIYYSKTDPNIIRFIEVFKQTNITEKMELIK